MIKGRKREEGERQCAFKGITTRHTVRECIVEGTVPAEKLLCHYRGSHCGEVVHPLRISVKGYNAGYCILLCISF
jgi:hypothetical protein